MGDAHAATYNVDSLLRGFSQSVYYKYITHCPEDPDLLHSSQPLPGILWILSIC